MIFSNDFHDSDIKESFFLSNKVMSLLFKPAGDELATHYGEYFDLAALSTISVGRRYEVLCSDGMNYIVEIKQFDPVSFIGHIHFWHWKSRFDFKGSIRDVYMTTEGRYSKDAGITASNTYETENVSQSARRSSQIGGRKLSLGEKSSYAANTKYDDDFFAKPRPKWAKRRRQAYESEMMPASYEERISVGDSSSGEEDVVSRIQSKCRFEADTDHDLHRVLHFGSRSSFVAFTRQAQTYKFSRYARRRSRYQYT